MRGVVVTSAVLMVVLLSGCGWFGGESSEGERQSDVELVDGGLEGVDMETLAERVSYLQDALYESSVRLAAVETDLALAEFGNGDGGVTELEGRGWADLLLDLEARLKLGEAVDAGQVDDLRALADRLDAVAFDELAGVDALVEVREWVLDVEDGMGLLDGWVRGELVNLGGVLRGELLDLDESVSAELALLVESMSAVLDRVEGQGADVSGLRGQLVGVLGDVEALVLRVAALDAIGSEIGLLRDGLGANGEGDAVAVQRLAVLEAARADISGRVDVVEALAVDSEVRIGKVEEEVGRAVSVSSDNAEALFYVENDLKDRVRFSDMAVVEGVVLVNQDGLHKLDVGQSAQDRKLQELREDVTEVEGVIGGLRNDLIGGFVQPLVALRELMDERDGELGRSIGLVNSRVSDNEALLLRHSGEIAALDVAVDGLDSEMADTKLRVDSVEHFNEVLSGRPSPGDSSHPLGWVAGGFAELSSAPTASSMLSWLPGYLAGPGGSSPLAWVVKDIDKVRSELLAKIVGAEARITRVENGLVGLRGFYSSLDARVSVLELGSDGESVGD